MLLFSSVKFSSHLILNIMYLKLVFFLPLWLYLWWRPFYGANCIRFICNKTFGVLITA